MSQATKRTAIWTKLEKKLVKPIMPEMAVRIGLPALMPIWAKLARLKQLRLGQGSAARLKAQPGERIENSLGEGIEVPDDEGEQPYI